MVLQLTLSFKLKHCPFFSKRSSSMLWKSYIFCGNCGYKVFSYAFYSCFKSVVAWNGLTSYIWVLSRVDCFAVLIHHWLYWINKFHFYQYKKTIMWFPPITRQFSSIYSVITNSVRGAARSLRLSGKADKIIVHVSISENNLNFTNILL